MLDRLNGDNAILQSTTFAFVVSVVENNLFNIDGTFNNTHTFFNQTESRDNVYDIADGSIITTSVTILFSEINNDLFKLDNAD